MSANLKNAIRAINKTALLYGSVSTLALAGMAGVANAQDESLQTEEVLVTGIRGSQTTAINTKRDAVSVVDAISAEDIGKLPDVTISDSLQRITGVQVQRTAGEGGPVQIRGLPNVGQQLNGETFLSATTIDQPAADFGDLPSQLFSGADVYKAPLASLSTNGISGTVNLKTRRPFDLDEGFTFSGSVEGDYGTTTQEVDPTLTGLFNWQNGDIGFLVAVATTEKNLATDYNGYFDTSEDGGIGAANPNQVSWGAPIINPDFYHIVPQGVSAFHKAEERHRDGLNASFQADLGNGFEVVADYFYSQQERWNRKAGFSHNNRWQTFSNYADPTAFGDEEFVVDRDNNGDPIPPQNWRTVTAYDVNSYRLQSFTQVNFNDELSRNANLELNYDNGGALTGQVRVTRASAKAKMRHGYGEGDIMSIDEGALVTSPGGLVPAEHCGPGDVAVGDEGGCYASYSNGIEDQFFINYDTRTEHPTFSGFDQVVSGGQGEMTIAEYMASKDSYHIGAFSSEGNFDTDGELNTFSSQWNYKFEDAPFITSVDFGLRQSERQVDREQFSYFGALEETGKCWAQWKAVDQFANTGVCENPIVDANGDPIPGLEGQAGEMVAGEFVPYTLLPPLGIDEVTNAIWIDDFGGAKGIPGVWAIDPHEFDDTLAFQEKVFGEQRRVKDPGQSYSVGLDEFSYFAQANFELGRLTGNLGVKVIETDLTVKQNEVGGGIPHSGASTDTGDEVTTRSYTDTLPTLNLNYDLVDDVVLRAGYGETMMPVPLLNWGGGKSVGMVFNESCNCMRVAGVTLSGNPELDPTRGSTYNLSAEWYVGTASMLSAALFRLEIDSFVDSGVVPVAAPDADGVNRGTEPGGLWAANAPVQGTGGEVQGVELAAKLAFSDLLNGDSFLSNFGVDANYTMSDSSQDRVGFAGQELPFVGNSEDTYNLVGWFENDLLSARLAYNYRSPRLITAGSLATGFQSLYQDAYGQLDMSVTVNVTDEVSVYLNGSNILEEYQQTYLEFEEQKAFQNIYEARWALGVRATF
jgi:iron complex outermembrane receptor protein